MRILPPISSQSERTDGLLSTPLLCCELSITDPQSRSHNSDSASLAKHDTVFLSAAADDRTRSAGQTELYSALINNPVGFILKNKILKYASPPHTHTYLLTIKSVISGSVCVTL